MLPSLINLLSVAISDLMYVASALGELPTASRPSLRNFCFPSARFNRRTTSVLSRSIMAEGVFAGAHMAVVLTASNPGRPTDAIGGNSGINEEGPELVTPNALSLPALMC